MDLRLAGKRAVVTGASLGIGRAVAAALVGEGVDVALVARTEATLRSVADELADGAGRAVVIPADTGDEESVRAMANVAVAELGGVDILVNSAAPPAVPGPPVPLAEVTDEALRAQMEVKVLGALRCARAFAPGMVERGWGRIISVSGLNARSATSLVGSIRNVSLVAMTKNLADQLGPSGVNATVVHPGYTVTERTPTTLTAIAAQRGITEAEAAAWLTAHTSIRRLITAEEVASVITFLASPLSVGITGDAIPVGGGQPGPIYY